MSEVYHLIKEEMRKLNSTKEIDEFLGHTRSQHFEKAKDCIKKADQFSTEMMKTRHDKRFCG